MRDERMGPNRKQRALMLQMNAVDRRIDQEVPAAAHIRKFGADRGRATEPDGRSKQHGRRERAMSTKKDIAPYSRKHMNTRYLAKNEPKTNPILIFKTTASSNFDKSAERYITEGH
jgi:hypothetical protein